MKRKLFFVFVLSSFVFNMTGIGTAGAATVLSSGSYPDGAAVRVFIPAIPTPPPVGSWDIQEVCTDGITSYVKGDYPDQTDSFAYAGSIGSSDTCQMQLVVPIGLACEDPTTTIFSFEKGQEVTVTFGDCTEVLSSPMYGSMTTTVITFVLLITGGAAMVFARRRPNSANQSQ